MCRVVNLEASDLRTAIRLKDSATGSSPIYATNSNYRKRKSELSQLGIKILIAECQPYRQDRKLLD